MLICFNDHLLCIDALNKFVLNISYINARSYLQAIYLSVALVSIPLKINLLWNYHDSYSTLMYVYKYIFTWFSPTDIDTDTSELKILDLDTDINACLCGAFCERNFKMDKTCLKSNSTHLYCLTVYLLCFN